MSYDKEMKTFTKLTKAMIKHCIRLLMDEEIQQVRLYSAIEGEEI